MLRKSSTLSRDRILAGASMLVIGTALASQAFAQDATASQNGQQVVVTASRIQRAGFTAPTPTQVKGVEAVEQQGLTDVAVFLDDIPAMHGETGPQATGLGNATTMNGGVSYVNLRSLGNGNVYGGQLPARTLVLVDGQRPVFNGTGGAVDLNMIPTIMIDHTDVVTGGASAQWGSDAVAGVVNLVYKKNFNGLQAEASIGQSTYGDDTTYHAAFVAGHKFLGDKLHVLLGASYDKENGIGPAPYNARPWAAAQYGTVLGTPSGLVRFETSNVQQSYNTYGGIITTAKTATGAASSLLNGTAFAPAGGIPYAYNYGNTYGFVGTPTSQSGPTNQLFGDTNYGQGNGDTADILAPLERLAVVMKDEYDITDHIKADLMLNYSYNDGHRQSVSFRDSAATALNILGPGSTAPNPFIPTSVQNMMTANNITSFTLGKIDRDFGPMVIFSGNQNYQMSAGVTGDFDFLTNWTFDAHVNYGTDHWWSEIPNNRLNANFLNSVAVIQGPSGPECASATARAAGCLPYNPFGLGVNSQATLNYSRAESHVWSDTDRTDFNANFHASPFLTWAGPVAIAFGGEYRLDSINFKPDANAQAGLYTYTNASAITGSINVGEAYIEADAPLAKDLPFVKSLDIDGAVREAEYKYSGANNTWKVGANYQIVDDFRFRISESQDVRAPNVTELFSAASLAMNQVTYTPTYGPSAGKLLFQQLVPVYTQGNQALVPEKALTFTYGGVFTPRFLPGFQLSVDYWDINIANAIQTAVPNTIVNNCLAGQASYCTAVKFDANDFPTIYVEPLNIGGLHTNGVDIAAQYSTPLSRVWDKLPGRTTLSWNGTYTAHFITTTNGVAYDTAGEVGGGVITVGSIDMPHWLWDANVNYAIGNLNLNLNIRYIGGGVLDVSAEPGHANYGLLVNAQGQYFNTAASKTYFNVGAQYTVPNAYTWGQNIQVFGNINNLMNVQPNAFGRDTSQDFIGRFYTIGLRLKM